jgi:hypothetical protein
LRISNQGIINNNASSNLTDSESSDSLEMEPSNQPTMEFSTTNYLNNKLLNTYRKYSKEPTNLLSQSSETLSTSSSEQMHPHNNNSNNINNPLIQVPSNSSPISSLTPLSSTSSLPLPSNTNILHQNTFNSTLSQTLSHNNTSQQPSQSHLTTHIQFSKNNPSSNNSIELFSNLNDPSPASSHSSNVIKTLPKKRKANDSNNVGK